MQTLRNADGRSVKLSLVLRIQKHAARQVVHDLRVHGIPIISEGSGYYRLDRSKSLALRPQDIWGEQK